MMKRTYLILLLVISFLPSDALAQKRAKALQNLGKFDTRLYHFGVQLSMNSADFFVDRRYDPLFADSVMTLQNLARPGFNIAIISELHLTKNIGLRFVPGISPKERILRYQFLAPDGQTEEFDKSIRSFYIDFPLNVKYRSDRIKNFAVYALAGGQLSRDMASQEKVNNANSGGDLTVIKIKRNDYLFNAGGGFDFFLPYFKFGIEMKLAFGLRDILIQDDTRFSTPLQGLRTRNYVLSFTFEG